MSTEETRASGLYYTVIDGTFRTKVDPTHPEAKPREYETKDGVKATKYERIVSALTGYVQEAGIHEGEWGKTVDLKLDPNKEGRSPIIQLNCNTTYGEDFLKKAPNVDFKKEVRLAPFSFTDENGREKRGITVEQDGEKIKNYFYDPELKENVNGYPNPEGETTDYSKEDWKIYFLQARKFLISYVQAHVFDNIEVREVQHVTNDSELPEELDPESVPF